MISLHAHQLSQLESLGARSTEWDDFVASVETGHVLQTMQWAEYRRKAGWHPIPLSFSSQGSLEAACIVLQRSVASLPVGGVLLVQRGPVLDYDSPQAPYMLSKVLDRLRQLALYRIAVVRVSPNIKRTTAWVKEMLLEKGFHRAKRPMAHTATIRLDLTQSLDRIVDGMSRHRRADIRRVERQGTDWSFHKESSLESLETLYDMYRHTIDEAGKSPKSFHDLRLMHETLSSFGSSFVLIVKYQDRPVASVLLVPMNKHFWGFGASMVKGEESVRGATVALYWEMIKWAKSQGYKEFDLQGIPDPPDPDGPLYGIYRFKQAWGGEEVQLLGEYDYSPYPFLARLLEWRLSH